ncbi:MAG: hypothetical protein WA655_17135 [Candidatus Korobacteraceae bacterium]
MIFGLSPSGQGWTFTLLDRLDYGRDLTDIDNISTNSAGDCPFTATHYQGFWMGYGIRLGDDQSHVVHRKNVPLERSPGQ